MAEQISTPNGPIAVDILGDLSNLQLIGIVGGPANSEERINGTALNGLEVRLKSSGITLPVSGPLTDAQLRATAIQVQQIAGATAVRSSVAHSQLTQTLLVANANRLDAIFHNRSSAAALIALGAGAGANDFSFRVPPNWSGSMSSFGFRATGLLSIIWEAADGTTADPRMFVTEVTP